MGQRITVGLIGSGIGPSLSPALHEAAGLAAGFEYHYELLDIDDLGLAPDAIGPLIASAADAGWAGLNITHPCKQAVLPMLDDLSPESAALGAVNTVVFDNGRAIGHNTDWIGFTRAFEGWDADPAIGEVVQIGAGGAGAAVGYALARLGAGRIRVADQDEARAATLCAHLATATGRAVFEPIGMPDLTAAVARAGGLVHVTPMGMAAHPGTAIDPDDIPQSAWVAEVVYRPLETAVVSACRVRGIRVLPGGAMAVHQAAAAFELFTGVPAGTDAMLAHLRELAARESS